MGLLVQNLGVPLVLGTSGVFLRCSGTVIVVTCSVGMGSHSLPSWSDCSPPASGVDMTMYKGQCFVSPGFILVAGLTPMTVFFQHR